MINLNLALSQGGVVPIRYSSAYLYRFGGVCVPHMRAAGDSVVRGGPQAGRDERSGGRAVQDRGHHPSSEPPAGEQPEGALPRNSQVQRRPQGTPRALNLNQRVRRCVPGAKWTGA
eukprot:336059-Prorocentrum_minimum.AAC.1